MFDKTELKEVEKVITVQSFGPYLPSPTCRQQMIDEIGFDSRGIKPFTSRMLPLESDAFEMGDGRVYEMGRTSSGSWIFARIFNTKAEYNAYHISHSCLFDPETGRAWDK